MKDYLTLYKKDIEYFKNYLLDDTIEHTTPPNKEWDTKTNIKYIMWFFSVSYEYAFRMYCDICKSNKIKIDLDWLEDDNGNLIEQE